MIIKLKNLLYEKLYHLISVSWNTLNWLGTDGEGEYIGKRFWEWLSSRGIVHGATTAYYPEFDVEVERLNRKLLDMTRTVLLGMRFQRKDLWAKSVNISAFSRNCLITKSSRERITPYEMIHGKRPALRHLKIFGSRTYVHKPKEACQVKFHSRALAETIVDYCRGNTYRVLLDGESISVESKDIRIVDCIGPCRATTTGNGRYCHYWAWP